VLYAIFVVPEIMQVLVVFLMLSAARGEEVLKAEDSPRLPTLRKLVAAEADAFHPVAPLPPAAGTARAGAVVARVPEEATTRRAALLSGARNAAGLAALLPAAAQADASGAYMTEEDEKTQAAFLAVITGIVLVAPTIGIYSAKGAIDAMSQEDDERFRGNTDPIFRTKKSARAGHEVAEGRAAEEGGLLPLSPRDTRRSSAASRRGQKWR
jgi:hypothetical protein